MSSGSHVLAWGWAEALRAGSTTTWQEWSSQDHETDPKEPAGRLPGAQQLALLFRLNQYAEQHGRRVSADVADRVLAASVSGRGRGDLSLIGDGPAPRFGPPPVDPADLEADELLRVASPLIADDVAAVASQPQPEPTLVQRARHRHRPWEQAFRIVGVPWRAQAAEAALAERGRRPGGRRPTAYLLVDDLGTMLAHAWTARAFDQGGSWPRFVADFAERGKLPPRADIGRMARAAAVRYGADQVVLVPDSTELASRLHIDELPEPPALGAHAIDLVRRVGEPLGMLIDRDDRPGALRSTLTPRLTGADGSLPTVAEPWHSWLSTHSERIRHDLEAAGYPVLGSLDRVLPSLPSDGDVQPLADEVLALALGLLLDPVTLAMKETT